MKRYKPVETTAACPTEDINKIIYHTFDEFQSSLSEKEILHPSEECHRQKWLISRSKNIDVINSYHVFCRLCKKHFYCRSVPTDINSFFQVHVNNEYHIEFRDSKFSHSNEMFTWEEKWRTGKCNVCQMSGLYAFVLDRKDGCKKLFDEHYCVWGFLTQESNEKFLRKISLLKKYCQLSIFVDKFIKPLGKGSACLICGSKIPWSGPDVKIHLGSPSHMNRFFWLVREYHNLTLKDLLNGFNLEMIARWVYCRTVEPTEEFQSDYEKKRLECYLSSRNFLNLYFSPSSGHYCPNLIEDLLAYRPSDFTQDDMCLLCDQPIVSKASCNDHFKSECHQSKLENLSEESFGNSDHYKAFCANRDNRLRYHAETIKKYKQLKENTHLLSLKVGVKNTEKTSVRKLLLKKLSLVDKPPPKVPNKDYFCEVCDLRISASLAANHATEFVHLYYCKKWKEVEKYAADERFFHPFQKIRNNYICLLCGVSAKGSYFLSHLKGALHTKNFEWYCTLKNEVPISSAIEIRCDLSAVCYLCDSLLVKRTSKTFFKINLRLLREHWPCPLVNELSKEAKKPLKANKNREEEEVCANCGCDKGIHKSDCATNSLNFNGIKNAISDIVDEYEGAMFEKVLDKTKSTIHHIELGIMAEWKQRLKAHCVCEKSRSRCKCSLNGDLSKREAVENKYQETEKDYPKNGNPDDTEIQEEKEQEISGTPGLGNPEKLESELTECEKHDPHYEDNAVNVMFIEGDAEKEADTNPLPMNSPSETMTVELGKISESKKTNEAISESPERRNLVSKKLPLMPLQLTELLEEPSRLFEFVANLTAAATAASESVMEIERERQLCATINSAVLGIFPQCRCYPFGSRLSGLMFSNSDLDVFLDCGGMYKGMENMPPSEEQKLIKKVAQVLRKKREITKLIIIGRARVPIISFLHTPTGIHCDLSFKNALSVHNTLLIKFLISLDHRVRFIVIFFKYWIKQNGIHGPPFFSSYAITMMAIFYLQQLKPPMLPTVEELQNAFVGRRLTIEGWDCSFSENVDFVKAKDDLLFHVILQDLFSYYANFDYVKFAISPLDGKPLPREAFSRDAPVKLPMCYKRHILNFPHPLEELVCEKIPICVIDPFDLSHVLTKSFTQTGLQTFKHFCQLSANALQKGTLISNLTPHK